MDDHYYDYDDYDPSLPKTPKDVNPVGYVAGGDLDFKKRPKPRPVKKPSKSMWVAYLCWLLGGWCSLHLLYLRRDRQALIWYTTFGGYGGIGILRDFFRIPAYVRDINESDKYVEELSDQMKKQKKPPFSLVRFVGQILVGNSWSFLIAAAVPRETILGLSLIPLVYLAPIGTALAVWTIGNIGREQGQLKWALIGAFAVFPVSLVHPPIINFSAVASSLLFNSKGKEWRRTPYPKASLCKRMTVMSACCLIFLGLWASHLYFNATVTDKHGEEIKLRDAAKNFLNSPMFLEFKRNLHVIYNDTVEQGWRTAWDNFVELLDPQGEIHALKVLGLKRGASQDDIKSAYKELAREWHPDRQGERYTVMPPKRKFCDAWLCDENARDWLKVDGYKAYWQICRGHISHEISTIKRHRKSKHDITTLAQHAAQPAQPAPPQAEDDTDVPDMVTTTEFKLTSFRVKHNTSFNSIEHHTDLLKDTFPDSIIAQRIRMKRTKAT